MATPEISRKHQRTETNGGTRAWCEALEIPGRVFALLLSTVPIACDAAVGDPRAAADEDPGTAAAGGTIAADSGLVDAAAFGEAFEVSRALVLRESDEVMTVLPMVAVGAPGEFLLAEPREGRVHAYDTAGMLRRVIGRAGEGPGEFRVPISARSTRDDGVVVADAMLSRLTFFPPGDGGEPEVVRSPLELVLGAQDLGDGRYLLSGRVMSDDPPRLLHVWNRDTGEVERSFMPIGVAGESRGYAASYTSVDAVLEGDTIWAVRALSDTLYKFDRDGGVIERFPLVTPRPMGELPGSEAGVITDPRAIQAAAETLTQVSGVFAVGDGTLAVQAMQARGFDAVWDLMILDRSGVQVWSAAGMPRLYAVVGDLFYFDDPDSPLPNHWVVARRRRE